MSLLSQFAQYSEYPDPGYMEPTAEIDPAMFAATMAIFGVFALILTVITYVIYAFLLGRIFKKAGVEQWKAWVPIYNTWVLLELGGQQGFWAILMLIPVINIVAFVFMYIAMYEIGLKLDKSGVFVLWAIFLPIVWLIWLAFDSSSWKGKRIVTRNTDTRPTASSV